ncbi:MAG: anti-sigma factor antagonist [Solirubrobacterales bacterium]|nr:anti-sigma factor antagonist [Solirubrobacterales bacterium]
MLAVTGELDMTTAPRLERAVEDARIDGWRVVVLDLRAVSFMDSSGLHLLLELRRDRRRPRVEMLVGSTPVVELMAMTGLDEVLPQPEDKWLESFAPELPKVEGKSLRGPNGRRRADAGAMANWALSERRKSRRSGGVRPTA